MVDLETQLIGGGALAAIEVERHLAAGQGLFGHFDVVDRLGGGEFFPVGGRKRALVAGEQRNALQLAVGRDKNVVHIFGP